MTKRRKWACSPCPAAQLYTTVASYHTASPPVSVTWGEGSKDDMGSISLITVPHEQSELATLRGDLQRRDRQLVRDRIRSDPALAAKVARILAE